MTISRYNISEMIRTVLAKSSDERLTLISIITWAAKFALRITWAFLAALRKGCEANIVACLTCGAVLHASGKLRRDLINALFVQAVILLGRNASTYGVAAVGTTKWAIRETWARVIAAYEFIK